MSVNCRDDAVAAVSCKQFGLEGLCSWVCGRDERQDRMQLKSADAAKIRKQQTWEFWCLFLLVLFVPFSGRLLSA